MKIPRVSVITLGVADLDRSTGFYRDVLATAPNTAYEGVTFIELPGVRIALYPREHLARDIGPDVPATPAPFSGVTPAYNAGSRDDVRAVIERVRAAGGNVVKEPDETFWGGFSGYFADPDGYHWEVAWGPMFEFAADGSLRFASEGP